MPLLPFSKSLKVIIITTQKTNKLPEIQTIKFRNVKLLKILNKMAFKMASPTINSVFQQTDSPIVINNVDNNQTFLLLNQMNMTADASGITGIAMQPSGDGERLDSFYFYVVSCVHFSFGK